MAVTQNWQKAIGRITSWETAHHKHSVFLITTNIGKTMVLKKIEHQPTHQRITSEYKVLCYLQKHRIPVSVPILTDDGKLYVKNEGHIFTLSPTISTKSPLTSVNEQERYMAIGSELGRFHRVMASYPDPIESWTMDLPNKLENEVFPFLEQKLDSEQFNQLQQKIISIAPTIAASWEKLPTQTIHGDFHGGNILFDGKEVIGIIDLDHIPIGARLYDISYFLADEVKNRIGDPNRLASWLASYDHLIIGYTQEVLLTSSEKSALWLGMLITQLLFIEWFVRSQNEEHVDKNIRVFNWIYDHQQEIKVAIS